MQWGPSGLTRGTSGLTRGTSGLTLPAQGNSFLCVIDRAGQFSASRTRLPLTPSPADSVRLRLLTRFSGTTVAIVGPSGCGKSTLVRCLYRFLKPKTGQILVDGQDIDYVKLDSLREHVAIVPQVYAPRKSPARFRHPAGPRQCGCPQ